MKLSSGIVDGREEALVLAEGGSWAVKRLAQHYGTGTEPSTVAEVMAAGEEFLGNLEEWMAAALREALTYDRVERSLAPIPHPGKVICVGLNYLPHAEETRLEIPQYPVLFNKFVESIVGDHTIVTGPEHSQLDYEAELVMVMGKRCVKVDESDALDYVFGYCNGNDISSRDLQFRTSQWLLGKALPGFGPIGPWVVTRDDVADPDALDIVGKRNGTLVQHSNTKHMIFSCRKLISYISQYMTLNPGDIIFTGTPEGVIMGKPEGERNWLKSGETVTVSVEGLGELTTHIG